MEAFTPEWAEAARTAIETLPDDELRATKLFMYWDWIEAARRTFEGSWAVGVRDLTRASGCGPAYVTFTFSGGRCTSAAVSDALPEATFVLTGDDATWRDLAAGYDAGKAVMYRRFRLERGDVFRFFDRIYLFTESLGAIAKLAATSRT